jgi:alkanesulfonate monooxygenase SsuD/methylene tetrahydromethanopterin reductase-like flavin-dependent oxidoreductase (luciferase family)
MLDEALDVLQLLLSGNEVRHRGGHYTADGVTFRPTPVAGRLPIWLAGRWPYLRPVRRAARYEGLFLIDTTTPADLASVVSVVTDHRSDDGGFDFVVEGWPDEDPTPWGEAGATWWLTRFDPFDVRQAHVVKVIDGGPPD